MSHTPVLLAYYYNQISFEKDTHIIEISPGEVIDFTFENAGGDHSEQHPFHIHGHAFWVLGSGSNKNKSRPLNVVNPIERDTFTLPHDGWVTIRMLANNPGVWLLHCHITWHMQMGMTLILAYPPSSLPPPPDHFPVCGYIKEFQFHLTEEHLWWVIYGLGGVIVLLGIFLVSLVVFRRGTEQEETVPLLSRKSME